MLPPSNASPFVDSFVGFASENEPSNSTSPFAAESVFHEDNEAATSQSSLIRAELYDPNFDQAVLEAAAETAAYSWVHSEREALTFELDDARAEQLAHEHLKSVTAEMERRLENLRQHFYSRPLGTVTETELDTWASESATDNQALAPSFENLFGTVFKKIKNAVTKGVKFIGKLALGPFIAQITKFIRPIIQRVLQLAFDKLPAQLRPLAEKLAQSFGIKRPPQQAAAATASSTATVPPPAQDASTVQAELDTYLSRLVAADSEADAALIAHEYAEAASGSTPNHDLATERERFVDALLELDSRDDPTPAVQRFLPAALLPLKAAIQLAGRGRVINFSSGLVAKLIGGIVGKANAKPLSDAIVKMGFNLLQLEAGENKAALNRVGANAIAATVEETARALADAPEHVLDDSELLEAEVLRVFHRAAARNLPPLLPAHLYREQPDLLESPVGGVWALMPVRGRKLYKKYSRVFDVKLTPDTARRLTLPRLPSEQTFRAHLYELVPGTTLFHVARAEHAVPGLGTVCSAGRLLPLTVEAASAIFGAPLLAGQPHTSHRSFAPRVGSRYVYLEPPTPTRAAPAPSTQVHLTLDLLRNEALVSLFIDEATAQELALKLRRRLPAGYFVRQLSSLLEAGVASLKKTRLAVIDDAVTPTAAAEALLEVLPRKTQRALSERLVDWVGQALAENRQAHVAAFLAATENPASGVSVRCVFRHAPGLATVRKAMAGGSVSLADDWFNVGKPEVEVRLHAGWFHA